MASTTLATTRGKFARVCIELDLKKSLKVGYRMRGRDWRLQYEGLHNMCFTCGKYGHSEIKCPLKTTVPSGSGTTHSKQGEETTSDSGKTEKRVMPRFGPWLVAQRGRRRPNKPTKGTFGIAGDRGDAIAARAVANSTRVEKEIPTVIHAADFTQDSRAQSMGLLRRAQDFLC